MLDSSKYTLQMFILRISLTKTFLIIILLSLNTELKIKHGYSFKNEDVFNKCLKNDNSML